MRETRFSRYRASESDFARAVLSRTVRARAPALRRCCNSFSRTAVNWWLTRKRLPIKFRSRTMVGDLARFRRQRTGNAFVEVSRDEQRDPRVKGILDSETSLVTRYVGLEKLGF